MTGRTREVSSWPFKYKQGSLLAEALVTRKPEDRKFNETVTAQAVRVEAAKQSPSGTTLEHTEVGSNWVLASEWKRVMAELHKSATTRHIDWLDTDAKYTTVVIDMRTGQFVLKGIHGERFDGNDKVLAKLGIKPGPVVPHTNC